MILGVALIWFFNISTCRMHFGKYQYMFTAIGCIRYLVHLKYKKNLIPVTESTFIISS